MNLDATNQQKWSDLLTQAVTQPGLILKAYSAFHGYSLGNQLGALLQCHRHGIEPGPIDTYKGWLDKGRHVRKGEKAIWLCMPLTRKKTNGDTGEDELYITAFVWKPRWFVLAQTDGEPVSMPEIPEWNKERALAALGIEQIPFTHTNGNVQGYAKKSQVAISPLAVMLSLFLCGARAGQAPRVGQVEAFLLRIIGAAISEAISLSVALKRPDRSFGAMTDSRASSFTVGSARV